MGYGEHPPAENHDSNDNNSMAAVSEIMQDVLKLPRSERSFLARKLLESLESDESFSAHEMRLFQSRSREIREGSVKPLTLEQLQQEVTARMDS